MATSMAVRGGQGMLSEAEIRHVLALARMSARPWSRLVDDPVVARVSFGATFQSSQPPSVDMLLLEAAARDLGFETSREEHFGRSAASLAWLVVVFSAPTAVNNLLKATNELPENFRKLRAKLLEQRGALLSPALQLEPVNLWLDSIYGAKQWRYDPDAVTVRVIAQVVIYDLTEEISGKKHLLLARGDWVVDLTDVAERGLGPNQAAP